MPTGPSCNLECEYCYYLEKSELYPERAEFAMSENTLEEFIRQYIESQPTQRVTFAWQGGEPTLRGLDFYRKVVRLQEKYAPPDKQIMNSIQTNGTRLNEEWCKFFKENEFLVGISIDGPKELHNKYRRTRSGHGTFEEVIDGLSLLKKHGIKYNVLCVVNNYNSKYPLRVYNFLKNKNVNWVQFIPLIEEFDKKEENTSTSRSIDPISDIDHENKGELKRCDYRWVNEMVNYPDNNDTEYKELIKLARKAPVSERSVDPEQYGIFMTEIFDEWVRNDVGEISVRLFDQSLEVAIQGNPSYCIFKETCGEQVAMEHNGDIYSCDHFVNKGFKLGNIHDENIVTMIESNEQQQFGEYKREGLPKLCENCNVRNFCNGGCPKNRCAKTTSGDFGLNYLCASYRYFFNYIQPYLSLLRKQYNKNKPLTNVMKQIKSLDNHYSIQ
ncbi:arylsulfatase regulatory protein [Halalkaliarchaeum desulfuricum]|uniref:Arylsulfatase regulatory protein n=2 Tax=Halalkaliarchaeum desulfuricum TaxID=2055893 RepID=A0A343TL80_9EURY|nr:arylsulfatase regulatory protein [Halalkaliarchaeum desulfuricum]